LPLEAMNVLRHLPGLHLRRAGAIARVHSSVWKFIKYIKEELLIVLGTSSSGPCCADDRQEKTSA
jgi:hypothetical protein